MINRYNKLHESFCLTTFIEPLINIRQILVINMSECVFENDK